MEILLLLLAFPIIWPFIAKNIWGNEITWQELAINVFGIVVLVSCVWFAGQYGAVHDTEIWNGKIVNKERIHDHYEEAYDCMCTTDKDGNESCSTCYEDHYTVTWNAYANFGIANETIQLKHLDKTSRSVYLTPDPAIFTNCNVGEPASKVNSYTNYVQAVPESLFNMARDNDPYLNQVPQYPRVYGKYRYDRVLNVGSSVSGQKLKELNTLLNNELRELGPKRQVNIIVIVTNNPDPAFRHTVENAWLGGEKNDAIIFIGTEGENIIWADAMTFALNKGNEMYHVTMRDMILDTKVFDPVKLGHTITQVTYDKFDRIQMEDFEYLADDIQPANWVIGLAVVFAIAGSIGLSFFMTKVDIGGRRRYSRGRRFNFR